MCESMFKIRKVFDCQDMPQDVRRKLFDTWDPKGNDILVEWDLLGYDGPVTEWLLANGATEDDERVIIKYWW